MNRRYRTVASASLVRLVIAGLAAMLGVQAAWAEVVTLNFGWQLEGRLGKISSLAENPLNPNPTAGEVKVTQIVLIDDDLRRTFVPSKQVAAVAASVGSNQVRIKVEQRVAEGGRRVAGVGPIIRITPWDEWGRRIFSFNTPLGQIDVVQGITEITPTYCRVQGLQGRTPYVWDMRVATSSIPRDTLSKILMKQLELQQQTGNPIRRLDIVNLYIQSERFDDARLELQAVLKDFPELADLQTQIKTLRQMEAQRLIKEIELRRAGVQHGLAFNMLASFPADGVAGETLLKVRDLLAEYGTVKQQGEKTLKLLETHLAAIADEKLKTRIEPIRAEIAAELNINTLPRMADYLRLSDDEKLDTEQKLSLAISGWLMGTGSGTDNLAVTLSLYDVRNLVREYLRATRQHERDALLTRITNLEGSTPNYLSKLIAHMKPAIETPSPEGEIPGLHSLKTPGLTGEPDVEYYVQLPPEYDPYRRYPCVLTLNGSATTELQQIDWWAGAYSEQGKMRYGQATRHGYIVVAPKWTREHQRDYEFSAREHAAVTCSLRDACRRFSIDTDKVFLSGHSIGGDAVWDIALAHPDLWAGVIPIVATSDKYIPRYWENGRDVPMYFVCGEMDGSRKSINGPELDRYLTKVGYDVVVVEYQGRGHEHYYDEIQRIFEWMNLHQRNFFMREFKVVSMRPWDNFFWWAELDSFPSSAMVVPASWPPPSGTRPILSEGRVLENNAVTLRSGAGRTTIWLAPEMVDFSQRILINGRTANVAPSSAVLLDDVRTRGDRQHPFWAKVEK